MLTFQLLDCCSHHTSHTGTFASTLCTCLKLSTAYIVGLSERCQAGESDYFISNLKFTSNTK